MTPETGWIVGTFTGRAVESVCATRYHAMPARAKQSRIRRTRTKTWTLGDPDVALRRGAGAWGLDGWRVAKELMERILVPEMGGIKPHKGRA